MTEINEERMEKYRRRLDLFDQRMDFVWERIDTDPCVVAPELKPSDAVSLVWRKSELQAEEFDIRAFRELSLESKHNVIGQHEVTWNSDGFRVGEFLHTYRKPWKDTFNARGVA